MFIPCDRVIILQPFQPFFSQEYIVSSVDEENTLVHLEGIESAFDFCYICKVN